MPVNSASSVANRCPEAEASFFSRYLTLSYLTPLLRLGKQRPLELDDVGGLHPQDESHRVHEKFNRLWMEELRRNSRNPSIIRVCIRFAGSRLILGWSLPVLVAVLQLALPLLSQIMIDFSSGTIELSPLDQTCLVVGMGVVLLLTTLLTAMHLRIMMRVGYQLRTALSAAIFRKSLLTSSTAEGVTTGDVVTLMSSDTQIFEELLTNVPLLFVSPCMLAACFYLLEKQIGRALIAGVVFMVCILPVTGYFVQEEKNL